MSMPWDNPRPATPPAPGPAPQYPPAQYTPAPPPQPAYTHTPAPVPPYQPPQQPQMVAVNDQTGQRVPVDINSILQQAINTAIVENKDAMVANSQRALKSAVQGKKPTVEQSNSAFVEAAEDIEEAFTGGPVTTRTFVQGVVIDIGFAVFAAVATVVGPGFDAFDKEAWTVVGALVLKTIVQTGMSYMMKLQVK